MDENFLDLMNQAFLDGQIDRETIDKNFPLPNSDRQLLRMKRSFNRLEKCCHEGLKTADTVEKLLNSVTTKFLGIFLGTRREI